MPEVTHAVRAGRIFETSLYGDDLPALEDFYLRVIGLETISRFGERGMALRCGGDVLLLFDPEATRRSAEGDPPAHGCRGQGHVAFAVPAAELPAWRDRLAEHGVEIETEVEWENGRSIYFRDPAGNSVELATPRIWGFNPDRPPRPPTRGRARSSP